MIRRISMIVHDGSRITYAYIILVLYDVLNN